MKRAFILALALLGSAPVLAQTSPAPAVVASVQTSAPLAQIAELFLAGAPTGSYLTLYPASAFTFTNCNADGTTTAAQTVPQGTWAVIVTDADVWICYASTCAANGTRIPAGAFFVLGIAAAAGQVISCRSSASNGDISFTSAVAR